MRLTKAIALVLAVLSSLSVLWLWQSRELQILSVQTGSMAPLLQAGDAVVVRRTDPSKLRVGHLVSLPHPDGSGRLLVHRIVQLDTETGALVTQGDANAAADKPTNRAVVKGAVQYRLLNVGYVVDGLRSWPGLVVAVYIPMALILAKELIRVGRYYTRPTYSLLR